MERPIKVYTMRQSWWPPECAGGMLIGLAFGVGVKWLLKWMRRRDAGRDKQICLTLAAAYLSFYVANSPAAVSGNLACWAPLLEKGHRGDVLSILENYAKLDSANLQGSSQL